MRTYRWNFVSGFIYLLIALFLLIGSGLFTPVRTTVEWYTVATIVTTLLASAVSFSTAWLDRKRTRRGGASPEHAPPFSEPEA